MGSHSAHTFLSLLERHLPALAEGARALPEARGLFWGTWSFCTSSSRGPFTRDWLSASQVRRHEPPTCADALRVLSSMTLEMLGGFSPSTCGGDTGNAGTASTFPQVHTRRSGAEVKPLHRNRVTSMCSMKENVQRDENARNRNAGLCVQGWRLEREPRQGPARREDVRHQGENERHQGESEIHSLARRTCPAAAGPGPPAGHWDLRAHGPSRTEEQHRAVNTTPRKQSPVTASCARRRSGRV